LLSWLAIESIILHRATVHETLLPTATQAIETPSIAPANFRLVIIAAPYVKPQLSVFQRPVTNDDKLADPQENLMSSP
jgi:hypothetical protein